jgi:DNA-binding MarR family transcriptional regulator
MTPVSSRRACATQFLILAALRQQQNVAVNALAERLDIERTAMGKMVGVLERDGLVGIAPSPTDGRSRIIELTAEGADLFEQAAPLWRDAQRRFNAMNGAEEVGVLRRSLAKMKADEGAAPATD